MLKIQLTHALLGTISVNPDPIGLPELDQTIQRSEENDGVVYEYELDLKFTKKGRNFLRQAYEQYGRIQAQVTANIFEYDPNAFAWNNIGTGKVRFKDIEIESEVLKANIEQRGFERRVLNLFDVDVDAETLESQSGAAIPATPIIQLLLHPKKIAKETKDSPKDGNEFAQVDVFEFLLDDDGDTVYRDGIAYGQINSEKEIVKEIDDSFTQPYGYGFVGEKGALISVQNFLEDVAGDVGDPRSEKVRTVDGGVGRIKLRSRLKHSVFARNDGGDVDMDCGVGFLGNVEIQEWVEHRNSANDIISLTAVGDPWETPGCGGDERFSVFETKEYEAVGIPVSAGDKFYHYFTIRIYGNYEEPEETPAGDGHVWHEFRVEADIDINPADGLPWTYFDIVIDTEFVATECKAVMIFELMKKMTQYCTDQEDSFRSDYFGRTDTVPAYLVDGPGSLAAYTNGRCIRKLINQTIFANINDSKQSLNSMHCLGFGFETTPEGFQVVRLDPKRHFYNKNDLVLDLGTVSKLKKRPAQKYYAGQVEIGYPKLDIQQINGVDEFNTIRKFKNIITEIATKMTLISKLRTSGYEIESERRLITSTKDFKLDDANFLISLVRDGLGFKPKTTEGYDLVENLYDPDSSYNLDLSPARNLRRWKEVFASMVDGINDKILRFSSGEGNYFVNSKRTDEAEAVSENGPIDLTSTEPIWVPEVYDFECPLSSTQMQIIRSKPYGYYKFREIDSGPTLEGYLLKVARNSNKKKGSFELLKVFRPV